MNDIKKTVAIRTTVVPKDSGYPHDGRHIPADKNPYPHDRRAYSLSL